MTTPSYIFDLDGTVCDLTDRLHHIQQKPKDWDSFFAAAIDDRPHTHIVALLNELIDCGNQIVFVSGRPERTRTATLDWLTLHTNCYRWGMPPVLYMRRDNDRRDDAIVKLELLHKLRADGYEPIMAFDDRTRVVKMWRTAGIPCAQVAEGDF